MPKKYNIAIHEAPPRFVPVGKSTILDWEGGCLRCFKCVKRMCIYDAYNKRDFDTTRMADTIDSVCKNCLRCVQMCPGRVISKKLNPEFSALGDSYWTNEIIVKHWEQSSTGKIPVSGAGYRGPFTGPGFDEMWTDMSEIVRPTRDGIHGREYINTTVSLGRKNEFLSFDEAGKPILDAPVELEIPVPILFSAPALGIVNEAVLETIALAAATLGTLAEIPAEKWSQRLDPHAAYLVPVVKAAEIDPFAALIEKTPMTAVDFPDDPEAVIAAFKARFPHKLIAVRIPADELAPERALLLARAGADVTEIVAGPNGNGFGAYAKRFVNRIVRDVHNKLVDEGIRDSMTLLMRGGVALAEHVAKAVICGADAVTVDIPLLLALECTLCRRCDKGLACPAVIESVHPDWGRKRIGNFMAAWRNQILEVLGAMGIREVRRLRGEVGRAMFFEDLERDTFGRLFGKKREAAEGANP